MKKFIIVITLTIIAVIALINFRHWVNRSEAVRAMENLGEVIQKYRNKAGSLPPQSYVDNVKDNLQGQARLGTLYYRAQWIDYDDPPETIIAYTKKEFHSIFLDDGFIVLKLNGNVQWLEEKKCKQILEKQQTSEEIQFLEVTP